jgi:hypothetical protein
MSKTNNIIDFYNRYGDKVYLEYKENNDWVLKGDAMKYCRILFDDLEDGTKHIYAVDPSGGPYLSEGSNIESVHKKITGIKQSPEGYILTLEDEGTEV